MLSKILVGIKGLRPTTVIFANFEHLNPNFFYATDSMLEGIFIHDFRTGKSKIITTRMYEASKTKIDIEVVDNRKQLLGIIKKLREPIAIDKRNTTPRLLSIIEKRKTRDVTEQMEQVRAVKNQEEINRIKKAAEISRKVFASSMQSLKPGMTELQLAALFNYNTELQGCRPAFISTLPNNTIAAFGRNTCDVHHTPDSTKYKRGDILLVDFGVRYKGYVSDVTRTLNSRHENAIKRASDAALKIIKPGAPASKADKAARLAFGALAKNFTHSLGHGIGIAIHEAPSLSEKSKDIFKPSMVFTIEPGLYFKNEGIRIENDYLMTKRGPQLLTKF